MREHFRDQEIKWLETVFEKIRMVDYSDHPYTPVQLEEMITRLERLKREAN